VAKISVVVLADIETHGDLGRLANALSTAKEAAAAGDDVEIVFDGAGTRWVPELAQDDHKLKPAFEALRGHVAGACEFCSAAFGVKEGVRAAGIRFLSEYEGHPSLRRRVEQGYAVITF
jgi:hypothetical protein